MRLRAMCVLAFLVVSLTSLRADTFGQGFSGYTVTVLPRPKVPVSFGALTMNPGSDGELILGSGAGGSSAAFYRLVVQRDAGGHIIGFSGAPAIFATAPKLDSGAAFGPQGHLAYTIETGSGGVDIGSIAAGSLLTTRFSNMIPETPGSLNFVPPHFGGAGQLKVLTNSGKFYSVGYGHDGLGINPENAILRATLPVTNAEGFAYVTAGHRGFSTPSMLVAEPVSGNIAAYAVDANGNPIPSTRRIFFSGPPFRAPHGLAFDRTSGDLLVSTRLNSSSAIYRISGFNSGPGVSSSSLSQCMEIATPGRFTLTGNLTDTDGLGCIDIHDTYNVEIECNNLRIVGRPAISVTNVDGFVIRNCRLEGPAGTGISVINSARGEIVKNTIGSLADAYLSTVSFYAVRSTVFSDNTIFGAFQQHQSTGTSVLSNRFTAPRSTNSPLIPGLILSHGGLNVQSMPFTLSVESNVIDGQSSPSNTSTGVQTAIGLSDAKEFNVSGNQIRNTILAAIMTSGNIVDSNFSGNTIDNTEYAISGRAWNSWTNVRVAGNHVSNVLGLFVLTRAFGLRPANWDGRGAPSDTGVYFQRNNFSGNRLTPGPQPAEHAATLPIYDLLRGYQTPIGPFAGERAAKPSEYFLNNNTFSANDFGRSQKAPFFALPVTPGKIIDGGGNICQHPGAPYPLVCN